MERNDKLLSALERLKPLYFECRRDALALSLAITLDKEKGYRASESVFYWAGRHLYRRKAAELHADTILKRIIKKTPEGAANTDFAAFSGLGKRERCAWVMHHVLSYDGTKSADLLGLSEDSCTASLAAANAALKHVSPEWFSAILERFMGSREVWEGVVFLLEKHYKGTRLAGRIVLTTLIIAAAVVIGRESRTAFRIFSLPTGGNAAIVSDMYTSESYYKRLKDTASAENPHIASPLWARLAAMEDGQMIRVSFRFYDPQVMSLTASPKGETLLSLYTFMYQIGYERGLNHLFLANAISEYYKGYVLPLSPEQRAIRFRSSYDSIYAAALTLAAGSATDRYSALLSSRAEFDTYLYSDAFLEEVQPIARLIKIEMKLQDTNFDPQNSALLDAYEDALYSFHNPGGLRGAYVPSLFSFSDEETDSFFALRNDLGKKLYAALVDTCMAALPFRDVTSDIINSTDSSLFSATLTKKEVMDLSVTDGRFDFLGIAAPYMKEYPPNIEHALAAAIAENKTQKLPVYRVDKTYLPYSINYMAPLNLPQGFIDQLRAQVSSKDTLFEQLLGYQYDMRFAHPLNITGYRILRHLMQSGSGEAGYCLQAFKNFTKISTY